MKRKLAEGLPEVKDSPQEQVFALRGSQRSFSRVHRFLTNLLTLRDTDAKRPPVLTVVVTCPKRFYLFGCRS